MAKKLKIWLPDNWANVSHQRPEGPLTICWQDPAAAGALQISTAEHKGGPEPRPDEADLSKLAVGFGERNQWGKLTSSFSGTCRMGSFGTATFARTKSMAPETPEYCQVWFLSNGLDFVFATFIATHKPDTRELVAAERIIEALEFR